MDVYPEVSLILVNGADSQESVDRVAAWKSIPVHVYSEVSQWVLIHYSQWVLIPGKP